MNVLYCDGSQVTLQRGEQTAQGPLSELRSLAASLKARGNTLLVVPAELDRAELPDALPADQVLNYLGAQKNGVAFTHPDVQPPRVFATVDSALLTSIQAASRPSGLRLTQLVPVSSAALRATGLQGSVVIIHALETTYEITILTNNRIQKRQQPKSERIDTERIVRIATAPLLSAGDVPDVVLVGCALNETLSDLHIHALTIEEMLQAATLPTPSLEDGPTLTQVAAGIQGPLLTGKRVPAGLLLGLGLSALLGVGVWTTTKVTQRQVAQLNAERSELQVQADAAEVLRASNTQLQTRNEQARTLTENKGPLATDLPLLAIRVAEQGAQLHTLAGPNAPTENDARAFGAAIDRTYDLNAETRDVQGFSSSFQREGLAADIRDVDCSASPCTVNLRAAPTELRSVRQPTTPVPAAGAGGAAISPQGGQP